VIFVSSKHFIWKHGLWNFCNHALDFWNVHLTFVLRKKKKIYYVGDDVFNLKLTPLEVVATVILEFGVNGNVVQKKF
jgi:hypothetical protein